MFNSMEKLVEDGKYGESSLGTAYDDTSETAIHNAEIERLVKHLDKLPPNDRKIILTIYGCDPNKVNIKRAAEVLNMKRTTVSDAHVRILEH